MKNTKVVAAAAVLAFGGLATLDNAISGDNTSTRAPVNYAGWTLGMTANAACDAVSACVGGTAKEKWNCGEDAQQ